MANEARPVLRFFPDHDESPFWNDRGESIGLDFLPLPTDLRQRLAAWSYEASEDDDPSVVASGRAPFDDVISILGDRYHLVYRYP